MLNQYAKEDVPTVLFAAGILDKSKKNKVNISSYMTHRLKRFSVSESTLHDIYKKPRKYTHKPNRFCLEVGPEIELRKNVGVISATRQHIDKV